MANIGNIQLTTNQTICFGELTANLTKDYSEKAFTGNSRFLIRRCFGSAEKITVEAFSFGDEMPTIRNCQQCGKEFKSYQPKPTFCSFQCRVQSQCHPVDVAKVETLYQQGHTQDEIAVMLGVTQKIIWKTMKRNGIKARPPIIRDQFGERNSAWKGDQAKYAALHYRVQRARGKASKCDVCGYTGSDRTYEWANLTKNYADVMDYKQMCKSCHSTYDDMTKNFKNKRGLNDAGNN